MRHVRMWLEQYETTGWFEYDENTTIYGGSGQNPEGWSGRYESPLSPLTILSERAGIDTTTLARMLSGKTSSIHWRHADALIAAMGDPMLWYCDPELHELYVAVNLEDVRLCPHGVQIPDGALLKDACADCGYTAAGHARRREGYRAARMAAVTA